MKNYKLFIAALVLLLIGLAGWKLSMNNESRIMNNGKNHDSKFIIHDSLSLALDWTPNTNHTGIYVAQKKGWYKDAGIELKILPYSSVSSDLLVSSGKADLGISSTESIVASAGAGAPVVSIAAIIGRNTSALVALNESGIARPRDLDGKTYGGFGAPFEDAVVREMIKYDGGRGEFKNVTLSVDAMEALKSGKIDFAWIFMGWDGIAATREKIGLRVFSVAQFGIPDYATPNIITSRKTIEKKKKQLQKFMSATAKGYEYARLHPNESAAILIDSAPPGSFPDPGLVVDSQTFLSPLYADEGKKWGLQSKKSWHDYPQFMIDHHAVVDASGRPVEKLNFDALYTNEFLQ